MVGHVPTGMAETLQNFVYGQYRIKMPYPTKENNLNVAMTLIYTPCLLGVTTYYYLLLLTTYYFYYYYFYYYYYYLLLLTTYYFYYYYFYYYYYYYY